MKKYKLPKGILYQGDVLEVLQSMEDESCNMVVTSPPYWNLRDYDLPPTIWGGDAKCQHVWGDEEGKISRRESPGVGAKQIMKDVSQGRFCRLCGAWCGCLGLEPTPELYVEHMVQIFREVRRVLRKDGTLWLNLSYSYAGAGGMGSVIDNKASKGMKIIKDYYRQNVKGFKAKDMVPIPWMVAMALQQDGWYLRSDIIWHKCLSGVTKVYIRSQKSVKPMMLRDLYRLKPETVELWNGDKWIKLKSMTKQPRKGNEIEIVLRSGERISCTPEHKWPTKKGLKEAFNLKVGDIIETCHLPITLFPKNPKYIPDEIGWFVGIYLAEGSRDSGGTIQIASNKSEIERYYKLQRIADDYGCTCRKHDTSDYGMTICLDGKFLNSIIDTYIAGKTAKDKHLSNVCWQRSEWFLRALLRGYLEGDGHWDNTNKRWRLGFTRNYNLESDIRTLSSILKASLTLNLSQSYIKSKKYDSFRGEIRYASTVSNHWNIKNKGEIVKIRKARARYFYDVTVEDKPHLFALASGVLTHNSNPLPESVTDRPTKAHEYLFLLTKSAKYFYDADAIREENTNPTRTNYVCGARTFGKNKDRNDNDMVDRSKRFTSSGRNKRTVWAISTKPFRGSHFAVFPPNLILPCILAGCPKGGIVLDPFFGSGTTGWVCQEEGRRFIGIELSEKYCKDIIIPRLNRKLQKRII
ncbi:MAG: DNA methyltransferase [Candidatus Hodarchaeales archaeon]